MIIVGVDTGVKYHAEACLHNGVLTHAALIGNVETLPRPSFHFGDWRLVIECATVRRQDGHTKKREVDALNRAAGRLGAMHPAPEFILPEVWKGQTPKAIDHKRTLELLTPTERALLPTKKTELVHVLDAVGIALWAAGRKHPGAAAAEPSPYAAAANRALQTGPVYGFGEP